METRGPVIHSFEAFHMISGHFVQYASPLKRQYQYFHPQEQIWAKEGVVNLSPEAFA